MKTELLAGLLPTLCLPFLNYLEFIFYFIVFIFEAVLLYNLSFPGLAM